MLQSTATSSLALGRLFPSLPYTKKDETSGNSIHPSFGNIPKNILLDLPTAKQNFFSFIGKP
jgi:hypothetical protein